MPAVANGFPPTLSGVFFICDSAIAPMITAAIPGTGPKHQKPNTSPAMAVIIEASASPWLFPVLGGRYGGGAGGCHTGGFIDGRSSGGIHAPGIGGCRGSHCVSCSEGVSTLVSRRGSRILGSQFGSIGGVNSWISGVPSSEQKLSHGSSNCLLHCGQYFIRSQTSSRRLKK